MCFGLFEYIVRLSFRTCTRKATSLRIGSYTHTYGRAVALPAVSRCAKLLLHFAPYLHMISRPYSLATQPEQASRQAFSQSTCRIEAAREASSTSIRTRLDFPPTHAPVFPSVCPSVLPPARSLQLGIGWMCKERRS